MQKRTQITPNLSIVKIVFVVCFLFTAPTIIVAEESEANHSRGANGSGATQAKNNGEKVGSIRNNSALANFQERNPTVFARLNEGLSPLSQNPLPKDVASLFIQSLPTLKERPDQIEAGLRTIGFVIGKDSNGQPSKTQEEALKKAKEELKKYLVGGTEIVDGKETTVDPVSQDALGKLTTELKTGLSTETASGTNAGANAGASSGAGSGATAGATAGAESGAQAQAEKPLTDAEKQQKAEEAELRRLQAVKNQLELAELAQRRQQANNNSGKSSGGSSSGGSGGSSGGSSDSNPPGFTPSKNEGIGPKVQDHTKDQANKETPRGNFAGNNTSFGSGSNNSSSNSESSKDPLKKDDKSGGFKLPEPKADKNPAKTVSKPDPKTEGLGDPSADLPAGPGIGYKNNLVLKGPSKVPNLMQKPDINDLIASMLGSAGGAAAGGGAGGSPSAGGAKSGAGGNGGFEGNPFNSNEGAGQSGAASGPSIRKISLGGGDSGEGEGSDSSSSGSLASSPNDFRKKGSLSEQIITFGMDDEERLNKLGVMRYVSRKERICTIPGTPLLAKCPKSTKSKIVNNQREEDI